MKIPRPQPDETLERYTIRAHRELMPVVTDPMRRNRLIREVWDRTRGPTEADAVASDEFSPDRYEADRDHCVFAEHEARDSQGNVRKYDLRELARIVRNCNERIVDASAFAALSDGHTSDPTDPNPRDPAVLGYAGPYRLGMIGRKNPKWAIFADEYHLKSAKPVLSGKPRRSVELWTFKDHNRSHFDPIAVLGADAPRLPLPAKFATIRSADGATVERYSLAAPSFPGGGNTHVKKFSQDPHEGAENMLSPEDLAQIMAALNETPMAKWVQSQMAKEQPVGPEGEGEPEKNALPALAAPAIAGLASGAVQKNAADEGEGGELDDLADLLGDDDAAPDEDDKFKIQKGNDRQRHAAFGRMREDADEYDAETKHYDYSAKGKGKGDDMTVERYAALQSSHQKLIRQHGRMHERLQAIERERTDALRSREIDRLANEYPGLVDIDEELSAVLYSRGANLSDDDFRKHVATVERYAQRAAPASRMIPVGVTVGEVSGATRERYEQRCSEEAVKIATAAADRGQAMNWETALEQAQQKIKV